MKYTVNSDGSNVNGVSNGTYTVPQNTWSDHTVAKKYVDNNISNTPAVDSNIHFDEELPKDLCKFNDCPYNNFRYDMIHMKCMVCKNFKKPDIHKLNRKHRLKEKLKEI